MKYAQRQCTLEYNALLWPYWSSLGFIWSRMAWFGLLWHHLTPFGPVQPPYTTFCLFWRVWPCWTLFGRVWPHLTGFGPLWPDSSVPSSGKRGGAREHCSQKEMDRTNLGRRIWAKFTALVAIFIKRAIYRTFLIGPMKNRFLFWNIKVLMKYMFISKEHILNYRNIPSAEVYKENQ